MRRTMDPHNKECEREIGVEQGPKLGQLIEGGDAIAHLCCSAIYLKYEHRRGPKTTVPSI